MEEVVANIAKKVAKLEGDKKIAAAAKKFKDASKA